MYAGGEKTRTDPIPVRRANEQDGGADRRTAAGVGRSVRGVAWEVDQTLELPFVLNAVDLAIQMCYSLAVHSFLTNYAD